MHELGITDLYASPILRACAHSPHGYDICDHSQLNPELGTKDDFEALSRALTRLGLGLLLDTVPNHMGIGDEANRWWMDVLENGPSSVHANHFDIDWHPVNQNLNNKVLLPVLEDQYGLSLEAGKIKLGYRDGAFHFAHYDRRFPVAPDTYSIILEAALHNANNGVEESVLANRSVAAAESTKPRQPQQNRGFADAAPTGHNGTDTAATRTRIPEAYVQELQSILTSIKHLPPRNEATPATMAEHNREKEVIKRRIAAVLERSPEVHAAVEQALAAFNGKPGDAASYDALDALLAGQVFRPAFWRVATEEINYRRFFDINQLAAIRVELPEVFRETHQLLFDLLARGQATGLRIDHPDGLWNPTEYFRALQRTSVLERVRFRLGAECLPDEVPAQVDARLAEMFAGNTVPRWPLYVVAEKILAESEPLPRDWAVAGTVGYDTLNLLNGLFVDTANQKAFDDIYANFLGQRSDFGAIVQASKRMIMLVSLASEINSLAHRLDRISERNRRYRDFTLNSLTFAIREIIAFLPIYRTYITGPDGILLRDRMYIEAAVEEAKRRNPRTAGAIFNFVRDTLLLRNLGDFREEDRPQISDWAMRFQQMTGPIMAKGVEDTAFYIFNRLVSLNEVGGHPDHFGVTVEQFHHHNDERLQRWPHSMLASSTHDTKRSEDVRARLNVLSEMPEAWENAAQRWSALNAGKKTQVDKREAPSRNDEYLLYQTLVGTWPAQPLTSDSMGAYRERIEAYMQKATKEAKVYTSWINPNAEYDDAMCDFVRKLLPDNLDDAFLQDFTEFQKQISLYGYVNSLAQTLLKLTCPGVPDLYQGTELWDFSLVDPDNRRPVDYARRRSLLAGLRQRTQQERNLLPLVRELMASLPDGRAKLYLIFRVLNFRRGNRALFASGNYLPCVAVGEKSESACAFTRRLEDQEILVAVPRMLVRLTGGNAALPLGAAVWRDTRLVLPDEHRGKSFGNILTGQTVTVSEHNGKPAMAVADLFTHFPVFLGQRTTG